MSMRERGATRELLSLGVIVAGAVVGLHLLAGEPLRQQSERAQRAVEAAQARLDEVSDPAPLGAGDLATLDDLRARARAIADANALGADQLRVYSVVTDIARASGVQIDRMEPASGGARDEAGAVASQAYEISALATFPSLVTFLERMQTEAGHARVIGFSIEPQAQDGRPTLRATIRTLHHAFNLGEARALADAQRAQGDEEEPR